MKTVLRALLLAGTSMVLAAHAACAAGPSACPPGAAGCVERLVVVRPDASVQESDTWLRKQGWTVVRRLDEERIGVTELALRLPSLDEVFFTLTGRHDADRETQEVAA